MDELVYELQQLKNTKELEKQKDTAQEIDSTES